MKTQKERIKELERISCIKLIINEDKVAYNGYLDLRGTGITSLPDNLTVGGYLDLSGTGINDTTNVNKHVNVNLIKKYGTENHISV